ncbi:MAG: hypothetical protein P1V51_19795 [Deltaproteobacteria bacterium]|nr:hypothetical protein [Deltaproteobacteria bacterium]
MSRANRRTYVAVCSIALLCDLVKKHQETEEPVRIWCDRIIEHVSGPSADVLAFYVTKAGVVQALSAKAIEITEKLGRQASFVVLLQAWMAWAEDQLERVTHRGKRVFYETLIRNLDGLYALLDPGYEHAAEAGDAVRLALELEGSVP